jgi:hypothetical protein
LVKGRKDVVAETGREEARSREATSESVTFHW